MLFMYNYIIYNNIMYIHNIYNICNYTQQISEYRNYICTFNATVNIDEDQKKLVL